MNESNIIVWFSFMMTHHPFLLYVGVNMILSFLSFFGIHYLAQTHLPTHKVVIGSIVFGLGYPIFFFLTIPYLIYVSNEHYYYKMVKNESILEAVKRNKKRV